MKVQLQFVLCLAVVLAGCGGAGTAPVTGAAPLSPTQYVKGVDHTYFPVTPGMLWIYEGFHEGIPRREEVRTLVETREILGIECTAFQEEVYDEGELVEVSIAHYAQDVLGNVWKFGEDSFENEDGVFYLTEDSWRAGVGDAQAWMAFAADPQVGDVYFGYKPSGLDTLEVTSLTAVAAVPGGVFSDCLQIHENPDDPEDSDIILYAAGVGRVSEESPEGGVVLVSFGPDPGPGPIPVG